MTTEMSAIVAEYDAILDRDPAFTRIRYLPIDERFIMYAMADGASIRMIADRLGLTASAARRKIEKVKKYVRTVSDKRVDDIHHRR